MKKKKLFNDYIYYMVFYDVGALIEWIDSRKGHRKARWLKKLNREINYVETHALFSRGSSVNDALTYLCGDANEIKDPCAHCHTREMYARQFDMHFYGDDCPYFCKGYEIYKGTIKKEEKKDEQV